MTATVYGLRPFMKGEQANLFKDLAYKLLTENRLLGTEGHKRALRIIDSLLAYTGGRHTKEPFEAKGWFPTKAWIEVEDKRVPAVLFLGSPQGEYEGYATRNYFKDHIALIENVDYIKLSHALSKEVKAVITYRPFSESYIYGPLMESGLPVVSVRREDVELLEDRRVKIVIKSEQKNVRGCNFVFEVGRGPVVYIIACMDTTAETYGAVFNGISVLLAIFLYQELLKSYERPYRLRFLLADACEFGNLGVSHHISLKGLKHVSYCINLEGVGGFNPSVIYRDREGYNGEKINELFLKHVEDVGFKISFLPASGLKPTHIPFRNKGVECLHLSSDASLIRHTIQDNYDAVSFEHTFMWYDVILSFLRRLHRL